MHWCKNAPRWLECMKHVQRICDIVYPWSRCVPVLQFFGKFGLHELSRCEARGRRGPLADSKADVTAAILCENAKLCKCREICSQTRRNPQSTDRHHRVDAISAPAAISTLYLSPIGLPVCLTLAHVSDELTRRRRVFASAGDCCTCRLDFIYMYFYTRRCLHSSTAAAAEGGCYDAQCVTVMSVDSIIWAVLCSPDGDWLLMCTEPVGVNAALSSASAASIEATHACCDRDILRCSCSCL